MEAEADLMDHGPFLAATPPRTIDVDRDSSQRSMMSLGQFTCAAAQMNRWLTGCEFQLGWGPVLCNCLVSSQCRLSVLGNHPCCL